MPTDVLIRTDALANISYYINFDDKEAISYHGISLWMSDWILMMLAIFNLRLQCLRNHKVSPAHAKAEKDY